MIPKLNSRRVGVHFKIYQNLATAHALTYFFEKVQWRSIDDASKVFLGRQFSSPVDCLYSSTARLALGPGKGFDFIDKIYPPLIGQ